MLAGYEERRLEVTVKENEFANLSVPLVRSTGTYRSGAGTGMVTIRRAA